MEHEAIKKVNRFRLDVAPETPLLWVIREHLQLTGTKFGCGVGECGSCTAQINGQARGLACHSCFGSQVAQVAEVSVDKVNGGLRVHRVVCAIDCGPVINPDTVRAQMEGGIIMGLSAALKEQVVFENGGVKSANFADYPLLRFSESPEIEVHLVRGMKKPEGVGEPGLPPIAPAVANGVFAAAGIRMRSLPLTPEAVRAAFKAA